MSNHSSSRWITIIILLFGIFLLSYYLGARFFTNSQKKNSAQSGQNQTTQEAKRKGNISLSPAIGTLKIGGEPLTVKVQSSGDPIQAADLVLTYDPKYVSIENIKGGKDFPMLLRQSASNGKIITSVSISVENANKPMVGEMITFQMRGIAPTEKTVVDFVASDTIAARDGDNILSNLSGGTYSVTK